MMEMNKDPEWLKRMATEEAKQRIYIPPSPGKFAVFGPGMSGTTDDFGLAQTWLLNNPQAVLYCARSEATERQRQEAECFRWIMDHGPEILSLGRSLSHPGKWYVRYGKKFHYGDTPLAAILSARQEAGK